MPLLGGSFNQTGPVDQAQIEAAASRRTELEQYLRKMEERYARYQQAQRTQLPDARYLKQCIDDLRRTLGVK